MNGIIVGWLWNIPPWHIFWTSIYLTLSEIYSWHSVVFFLVYIYIYNQIFSDILSGILCGTLSDTYYDMLDILSGILFNEYSEILSCILCGILSDNWQSRLRSGSALIPLLIWLIPLETTIHHLTSDIAQPGISLNLIPSSSVFITVFYTSNYKNPISFYSPKNLF